MRGVLHRFCRVGLAGLVCLCLIWGMAGHASAAGGKKKSGRAAAAAKEKPSADAAATQNAPAAAPQSAEPGAPPPAPTPPAEFSLQTPPGEVLRHIPELTSLAPMVSGGWGKSWREASILADDSQGSDKLTTPYVVAVQNLLMALRASLEKYPSLAGEPQVLVDYERVSREFYWGAEGQAYERIVFKVYTVPAGRQAEAQRIADDTRLGLEEKRRQLDGLVTAHDAVYWFDISAPFRHNSAIIWR